MFKGSKQSYLNVANCVLNSYAQVFFSKNRFFAIILILVTFFDLYAGIAGLAAVIIANLTAIIMGMNRQKVISGAYGFNALMVGLGIGIYYQPSVEFYIILIFISILTFMITISLEGIIGKYGLPYLSIPFLFGIWMVIIATKGYSALEVSERGIYYLNDMYAIGGATMVNLYEWFNNLNFPEALRIYFKSLSAILFQYHMFAGILLAIGLVYYSRIAFLMSLIGFFSAYYFYLVIGANISELSYSYIGFNYILTSIAVGGFFVVPSRRAVIWVILLTPLVAITLSSTSVLLANFQLSAFSLPFNIIVILFLYVLKFRERNFDKIAIVAVQQNSPELHAYSNYSYMKRFGILPLFSMKLPFWGEWKITQAHNGEITHKDKWRHAWDFEIFDDEGNSYEGNGVYSEQYYCFNKPVVAPGDGIVEEVRSGIEDNFIGNIDIDNNWGNSVVIKHAEHFYTQVSHLKKDSIKVVPGQTVKQGEIIGHSGNSGRSPYPHLHMQFQATPTIGSNTIDYPFSSLIIRDDKSYSFRTACKPENNIIVSNAVPNDTLKYAFNFTPGAEIKFETEENGLKKEHIWSVESDIYNNTSIACNITGDTAWFKSIGDVFYFTYYKGGANSLLYYFYLSSFKLTMAYYNNMEIHDSYPLNVFPDKKLLVLQDFAIPFYKFLRADYSVKYSKMEELVNENRVTLRSQANFGMGKLTVRKLDFTLIAGNKGIAKFTINENEKSIIASRKF
ncbi:MAG: urea transporter [Bacteroidetes bacterium]|nr:urea transporter [Bacteroidota bacterium]MBL6944636.1 urea transporter [Bacteroidales bacterium]